MPLIPQCSQTLAREGGGRRVPSADVFGQNPPALSLHGHEPSFYEFTAGSLHIYDPAPALACWLYRCATFASTAPTGASRGDATDTRGSTTNYHSHTSHGANGVRGVSSTAARLRMQRPAHTRARVLGHFNRSWACKGYEGDWP